MNDTRRKSGVSYLIVTGNFLEAADLKESIRNVGEADILHLRKFQELYFHLNDASFLPDVAFLSCNDINDAVLDAVVDRLERLGTRVVVIHSGQSSNLFNSVKYALERPFSLDDLQVLFNRLTSPALDPL